MSKTKMSLEELKGVAALHQSGIGNVSTSENEEAATQQTLHLTTEEGQSALDTDRDPVNFKR